MNVICKEIQELNNIHNSYTRNHVEIKPQLYKCPSEIKSRMPMLKHGIEYYSDIRIPIHILFFTEIQNDCLDRFHIIMTILRYMLQFPNNLTSIRIDFAFTDISKTLPHTGLIGPSTLNTGYTIGNQIVVYREEEWLKVCIHECIHLFNYDIELRNKPKILYPLFPISKKIHVNESYCEIWARILNCCVISVMNNIKVEQLLKTEGNFAIEQMVKILNYMNLTYIQLTNPDTIYKEKTNAFAYLVIPAILLHDPSFFVTWCKDQNTYMLPIENADAYIKLIQSKYTEPSFLKNVHHTNTSLSTTMSINNIHL